MLAKMFYELSKVFGYKELEQPAWETVPKQESQRRLSQFTINEILEKETHIELQTLFKNADLNYKTVDIHQLERFVIKNNLAKHKYVPTERDCDDFSFMLQGDITHWDPDLAFGIVWGITPNKESHAWNWCIGTDEQIWFVEPKTNKVFRPNLLWKITLLVM